MKLITRFGKTSGPYTIYVCIVLFVVYALVVFMR